MEIHSIPTRREMTELLIRAAALPGAANFLSGFLQAQDHSGHGTSAAPPDPNLLSAYVPTFFAAEDFGALQAFTEILIPTDDTPGAREAHCAHFIDFLLQASSALPQTQTAWRRAMEALKATGFTAAGANRRLELVMEMSRPETDPSVHHPAFFAYRLIKQQTAFAFYTSRQGLIETLDYKGNSYNAVFPPCNHPEHHTV